MIYFRTYAKEHGCPVNKLGDLAIWNFIIMHQSKNNKRMQNEGKKHRDGLSGKNKVFLLYRRMYNGNIR